MKTDEFQELALKVLAREATAVESAVLQSEVAKDASRRREFDELRAAMSLLREAGTVAGATRATTPELPKYRMNELRDAVRLHFLVKPSEKPERSLLPLPLRWLLGTGFTGAALACLLLWVSASRQEIEVGMYKELAMRSGAPLVLPSNPHVQKQAFEKEEEFEKWKQQPLAWNQRAKVWVDEENDTIHIIRRDGLWNVRETTQPLAAKKPEQQIQVGKILQSLE